MDLDQELRDCYGALADAITTASEYATEQGIEPKRMLTTQGEPVLGPLLAAQAQLLVAIASRETAR